MIRLLTRGKRRRPNSQFWHIPLIGLETEAGPLNSRGTRGRLYADRILSNRARDSRWPGRALNLTVVASASSSKGGGSRCLRINVLAPGKNATFERELAAAIKSE